MSAVRSIILITALAIVGLLLMIEAATAPARSVCMDEETREHARAIMLDAIDDALKRQFRRVYQSWMSDVAEQPHRAIKGMQRGMDAYIGSRRAAKAWNPPLCAE